MDTMKIKQPCVQKVCTWKKKKKVSSTIDRFIGQGIFNKTMNLEQRWDSSICFSKLKKPYKTQQAVSIITESIELFSTPGWYRYPSHKIEALWFYLHMQKVTCQNIRKCKVKPKKMNMNKCNILHQIDCNTTETNIYLDKH